jgi:galactose mutarotase-like enzyme
MGFYVERNYGCRIHVNGTQYKMQTVVLQNELLRISFYLDRGTDIFEFMYKPKDIDFLWRPVHPVVFPVTQNYANLSVSQFNDMYMGGWQELFPNGSGASQFETASLGFHGEVAFQPWNMEVIRDDPDCVQVKLWIHTVTMPYKLEKTLTLKSFDPILYIDEKISNLSDRELPYMWGHHPTFGYPFVTEKCRLDLPPCKVQTMIGDKSDHSIFAGGEKGDWPYLNDKQGNRVDLRFILKRDKPAADMIFASGLEEGWYTLSNDELGLGFGMRWPAEIFSHLWIWREWGGTKGYPYYGSGRVIAVEPFSSKPDASVHGLEEATKNGTIQYIAGKQEITVSLKAFAFETKKMEVD